MSFDLIISFVLQSDPCSRRPQALASFVLEGLPPARPTGPLTRDHSFGRANIPPQRKNALLPS